jgi:hypothetical protein
LIRILGLMVLTAGALAAGTVETGAAKPSGRAITGYPIHAEAASPEREALLEKAEQALRKGELAKAQAALEAAALLAHSADTEMLQVRAMMQAGDYRHAVAFAAHTAGAHVDEGIAPNALYAWLLYLGGQGSFATRMLDEALAREPGNELAQEVKGRMGHDTPPASPLWFEPPHRLAPYPVSLKGKGPPAEAEVRGNGVLWEKGQQALVPMSAAGDGTLLWVRNGLGQTVPARSIKHLPELQLALLQLQAPLPLGPAALAIRDPFAGSAGSVADYPLEENGAPAWPRLHPGFLGGMSLSSPVRRLGIALPSGPRGGPVFDGSGRLAGIAMNGSSGQDILVTVSQLRMTLGTSAAAPPGAASAAPMPLEESYEAAMQLALQLIAAPSSRSETRHPKPKARRSGT